VREIAPRPSSTSSRPRTATSRPAAVQRGRGPAAAGAGEDRRRGRRGAPAFRERFAEDYALDEELKLLRQALGDDIVDWLDSRWSSLLKAVYAKKKIPMFIDDEEVGTFLYDEGLRFGTLYPITEKSLAGRVKQVQPFVDHLARKRDQDKRKITS
jgi:hypothetical protein